MAQARISKALKDALMANQKITTVFFTEDGQHHFHAFEIRDFNPAKKGDTTKYTQLQEVPERTAAGVYTGKSIMVPYKTPMGADDPRYLVVAEMTREAVLSAPINVSSLEVREEEKQAIEGLMTQEQWMAATGITPDTVAFLKQLQAEREAAIAKGVEPAPEEKPKKK